MTIKPKIAFVSTMFSAAWGGCEDLWYETAMAMLPQGYPIAANICKWHDPVQKFLDLEKAGAEVGYRPQDHEPNLRLVQRLLKRFTRFNPFKWLVETKPDLVVVSLSGHHQGHDWMHACQAAGLRYVVVVHAVGDGIWPNPQAADTMRRNYEAAEQVYFVSKGNLEQVKNQIAAPLDRSTVIRNPYNVSYDAKPKWPGEDTTILACVGRLHPVSKGQDVLFSVLSQKKWKDRPLKVRLYGGGPDEETLRKLHKMYDLTNVTFAGFQKDVEQIWRECHGLILPSRYEGLPLAIVEAMLCARPCIVTDVAGNAELMEDNVSGFVAPAPRFKYIDEALERAWSRRNEWESIGQTAACAVRKLVPPDPIAAFQSLIVQQAEMK